MKILKAPDSQFLSGVFILISLLKYLVIIGFIPIILLNFDIHNEEKKTLSIHQPKHP